MIPWWWLIVAFVAGLSVIGIPALIWLLRLSRSTDRAWGMR